MKMNKFFDRYLFTPLEFVPGKVVLLLKEIIDYEQKRQEYRVDFIQTLDTIYFQQNTTLNLSNIRLI